MEDLLAIRLIVMLVCGCIAAAIANSKGRSSVGWFFGGFFLTLLGIIIVAVLPNQKEQKFKEEAIDRENRRLREQLLQEQIKTEAFRRHAAARLDAHDSHLGIDTRPLATALPAPAFPTGLPEHGADDDLKLAADNWPQPAPQPIVQGIDVSANGGFAAQPPMMPSAIPSMQLPGANNSPALGADASNGRQWYYDVLGATRGPISDKELVTLAQRGEIKTSTLVWTEQLHDWKPANSIKPLRPFLQS